MPEEEAVPEGRTDTTADEPDVPESRKALVTTWLSRIEKAQAHPETKKAFKVIKENQYLAAHGGEKKWVESGKYVVPITNRHINQSVGTLYAKNPKAVAKRKPRLHYKLWDGRQDTLTAAGELALAGDEAALQLIEEVLAVRQQDLMLDRMGETMVILWDYFLSEQSYNYKQQLKAAVRRAKVCKVAYIKLGFQRILEKRPEITAEIEDVTSKISAVELILMEAEDDELDEQDARLEELRTLQADLQKKETLLVREGPILDFPRATEIIVDPDCRHLKSFAGARWVDQLYEMTPEKVREVYKVNIKGQFKAFDQTGKSTPKEGTDKSVVRVHEVWDKRNRQTFTVAEGYPDFLVEPHEPDTLVERFWPFFPIVFNEIESDDEMYPPSDVENAKHIQNEYNRSRESLREHRQAARPWYVEGGRMEEGDKEKVANHQAFEVVTLKSLSTGESVEQLLQAGPTANIDPNLYEVEMHFTDLLRAVGTQEANLGGTSGDTATEATIAETSRSAANADNIDDLDEVLTELARAMSQLMLAELSKETVIEIVGEGAVWPDFPETREEIAKEIGLEIEAGSSGRPNEAAELAKMERGMPTLLQLPGINPAPIGRKFGKLMNIDTEEMLAEGLPSITAINAMLAKAGAGPGGEATGDAGSDPNQQGGEGASNAPGAQQNERAPSGQPSFPA